MALTTFGTSDPKTIKKFSVVLAAEAWQKSFWGRNFMSMGTDAPLQRISDLASGKGDQVTVDLFTNLSGTGVKGDALLKGNEEALVAYTQNFYIDQLRHGVSLGGNMTRQRTVHDLRSIARDKLSTWWARLYDEALFIYLCGARGVETGDWLIRPNTVTPGTSSTGTKLFGNNSVMTFSAGRTMWANSADTADSGIAKDDAADQMSLQFLDRIIYQLQTMAAPPKPLMINGEACYILIMHPSAEYELRTNSTNTLWRTINSYTESGRKEIYGNGIGKYRNLILYAHPKIPVLQSGSNCGVCHNILMGAQAGFIAHGTVGDGLHYSWHEEVDDRGALPVVDTGTIFGVQRAVWNSTEFSTISIRTAYNVTTVV